MRNPLLDPDFLERLDSQHEHGVYAKIIALDFEEHPTEEITGKVTQGSVNVDGTSAIRRSCSVSLVAQDVNINEYYWGLNTKFELKVGLRNYIDPRYEDIIWFKQGIYLITSFNTSLSTSGYNISISGKDKMCLLNGDIGGTINSLSADFGTYDEIDADGTVTNYDYPIKEIILEGVHQYAGEPYHNIVVEDLDDQGFELMEYRGDVDLYMLIDQDSGDVTNIRFNDDTLEPYNIYDSKVYYKKDSPNGIFNKDITYYSREYKGDDDEGNPIYAYHTEGISFGTYKPGVYWIEDTDVQRYTNETINLNSLSFEYDQRISALDFEVDQEPTHIWVENAGEKRVYTVARVQYGETCGYRLTELTFAGDLIAAVGNSFTSAVLDKIVGMLGEYEYFYDVDGVFHFRRKKTYVNNSWNNIINHRDEIYADSAAYTSAVQYSFTDSKLVSAFQNTPDFANLRNDFSIWGKKDTSSGSSIPIHLRYAIDNKAQYYKNYSGKIYITKEEYDRLISQETDKVVDLEQGSVSHNVSRFHVTPLPAGLSQDWWEIDDWARKYMYYADVNNEHDIDYYLNLTSEELCDIVNKSTKPTDTEVIEKTFNYYVYQLQKMTLGNFGKKWKSEDWLGIFPLPNDTLRNQYYNNIVTITEVKGQAYWAYLFDTALYDGQEYIKSIEHGYAATASTDIYPTSKPDCSHVFSYALQRKHQGADKYYHSYIYDPEVPDSLKNDSNFADKIGTDEEEIIEANFEITDWREIIFQMAKDYYKYQHDDDFLATVAANNPDYYPLGYTGYEQYYIDINGFWRELYNPDILPIAKDFAPTDDINHYYIWHDDTQSFTDYTFREATKILPMEDNVDYYYYKGQKTLDNLIAIEQEKQDAIDNATSQMSKELKSLNESDFSTHANFVEAQTRITTKYTTLKAVKTAELEETATYNGNVYKRSDFLKVKKETIEKDGTVKVEYDYDLAAELVHAFYPTYDQLTESTWKDYELYTHFDASKNYYTFHNPIKDLSQLSSKVSYYTRRSVGGQFEYSKWNQTMDIDDPSGKPNELGDYPKKTVPLFDIGKVYYTYEGYEKVSSLEVGENGNTYYSYSAYKIPSSYDANATYYTRSLGSYVDDNPVYIFTKYTGRVTNTNYTQYYVNIPNPNNADKSIVKGYSVILQLDKNKTYYSLITDSSGKTIESTPTYFTRGKSYYSKTATGDYEYEFTFERGTVYYLYNGFKEAVDLTIDDNNKDKFSSGSYYYLLGESNPTIMNSNNAKFLAGKIYCGYKVVNKDAFENGKYYMTTDGGQSFSTYNVLKEFARGSTYYIYAEDYDLIDPYEGFNSSTIYYVYTDDGKYKRLTEIISSIKGEATTLTKVQMNDILSKYGAYVNEDGIVYRLGQAYKFYIKQKRYREVNYYAFAFYEPAEKYYNDVDYYIKEGRDFVYVGPVRTQTEFEKDQYYVLLDGYTRAPKYDESATYFTKNADGSYSEYMSKVTKQDFNTHTYYIKKDLNVYLTNEFNINTHWTMNLEYPEDLIFWFDFLDLDDGELAQYSVHAVGDRPKSVNDDNVKAIYYRDTPTVIFCGVDGVYIKTFVNRETFERSTFYEKSSSGKYSVAEKYSANKDYYRKMTSADKQPGYTYINLTDTIDNLFSISSQGKTSFDMLNNYLYNYSYCTESITMTTIPVYYLEPNARVFVYDPNSGIEGEYIISRLTIPLQYNGTMQITATKAVDRIL